MKRLVLRRREEVLRGGQPLAFFVGLLSALVVGAVLLTVSATVLDTYQRMWDRSFGTADTLSATINQAVPLALAGLAVSIAATMGLWNIGAEGQIMFGATAATLVPAESGLIGRVGPITAMPDRADRWCVVGARTWIGKSRDRCPRDHHDTHAQRGRRSPHRVPANRSLERP